MIKEVKRFLKNAFFLRTNNPDEEHWNKDAFLTISGLTIWGICAIGEAFGFAVMPSYVVSIGPFLFGLGVGRASKPPSEN
jgi:hypothetical protein